MSEKLENKNKKKRRSLPGALPCAAQQQQAGPARGRPSPPAPLSSSPPRPSRCVPAPQPAAATRSATPPPSLPACLSPPRLDAWNDATQPPRSLFPSLSLSLLPGSLFPERTRALPPPSLAVAVATGLPSPPGHTSELRHNPLHLLTEPRGPGRAATPPPSPFPSPATEDRRGRFAASDASPRPPSCSSTSP